MAPLRGGGGCWGPLAVEAGIVLLINDGEGHVVTGGCGRVLFFRRPDGGGPWMTAGCCRGR